MSSTRSRAARIGTLALAAGAAVAVGTAAGTASAATTRIGPHQFFIGSVNGHALSAAIQLGCFGPGGGTRTGHPLPGQYVAANRVHPELIRPGFTGTAATAIDVSLVLSSAQGVVTTYPVGTLTGYGTRLPIPVTLNLPCSASGRAVFTPTPSSASARPYAVRVTLVGQP
jgi:hypothetical protein